MKNQLRVYWVPQLGINNEFYVPVDTPEEGFRVITMLSAYDCFEYNNRVKGDYMNFGGLQMLEDGEWVDWMLSDDENDRYYESVDEYMRNEHPKEYKQYHEALLSQVHFD